MTSAPVRVRLALAAGAGQFRAIIPMPMVDLVAVGLELATHLVGEVWNVHE